MRRRRCHLFSEKLSVHSTVTQTAGTNRRRRKSKRRRSRRRTRKRKRRRKRRRGMFSGVRGG